MKRFAICIGALLLMLMGCAQSIELIRTEAIVHYKIVETLDPPQKPDVVGFTRCSVYGVCEIQILKNYYPECLQHEGRHVFEGEWHGAMSTACVPY